MIYTINQIDTCTSNVVTESKLSNYVKKVDALDKTDYEMLKVTVANKADKNSSHTHSISDITELQNQLNNKLNNTLYSYKTIINDFEKIDYITSPKVDSLKIGDYTITSDGNSFSILNSNKSNIFINNLTTQLDDIQLSLSSCMNSLTELSNDITKINEVLDNHKEVIEKILDNYPIASEETE